MGNHSMVEGKLTRFPVILIEPRNFPGFVWSMPMPILGMMEGIETGAEIGIEMSEEGKSLIMHCGLDAIWP